jgi:hypothetical protein
VSGAQYSLLELELELIQTRMIQKPLLRVEVGKSACVLVGICELRLSLPARYDPQCQVQCPSLLDFLSGCLVRVLWIVGLRQILYGMLNMSRPIIVLFT